MKRFKVAKKVMALALCIVMCMASVLSVSAAGLNSPRIVTDSQGIWLSKTYLTRTTYSYSMETEVTKNHYGSNKYTSYTNAKVTVVDSETEQEDYRYHSATAMGGTTLNAKISYRYTDYTIKEVIAKVTTWGYSIDIEF